jgi:shikimate dehydrogenase
MSGQPPLEISLDALPKGAVVTDIVYSPLMTDLLTAAEARGHVVVDGLGMLLHQGKLGFDAFFGHFPEVTQELRDFVLAGRGK